MNARNADERTANAIRDGADRAIFAWLNEHPLSVQPAFMDAISTGVRAWLDANRDAIIEAILSTSARKDNRS